MSPVLDFFLYLLGLNLMNPSLSGCLVLVKSNLKCPEPTVFALERVVIQFHSFYRDPHLHHFGFSISSVVYATGSLTPSVPHLCLIPAPRYLIIENFIPPEEKNKIMNRLVLDCEEEQWKFQPLVPAGV